MTRILTISIAAVTAAAALTLATPRPAAAQVVGPRIAGQFTSHQPVASAVQWRRGRSFGRRGGWRRGWGPGVGFGTGLVLGGALFAPRYYYYDDPDPYVAYPYRSYPYDPQVAYCMQRYKSYDPYSRTYLGFDGRRHRCP